MLKRAAENRERKTTESAPGTATSGGACSRGKCRKPRQHWGNGQKKSQPDKGWDFTLWWSWGDSNPRPQIFHAQFYMLSGLFCVSPVRSRSRTLPSQPVPLDLARVQGTRTRASRCEFPRSRDGLKPPLPSPSACCCEAHRCLGGECETFVVCSWFVSAVLRGD